MPIVRITLINGYEAGVRRRLSERITHAVAATMDAPLDAITVVCDEVDHASYMRGGTAKSPGPPSAVAGEVVQKFLALMEARDLDGAQGLLAPGFVMVFPGPDGGTRMETLEALVAFSAGRYRFVKKVIDSIDESYRADATIVHVSGMLHGEDLQGRPFSARFIDRFAVEKGLISRQEVWNDLALVLGSSPAPERS